MLTVDEFMSRNPVTLSRFDSLADARKLMAEKGFRHIPIVEDKNYLIGLVSQRNVLAHGTNSQTFLDQEELAKIESGTLLADIMVTDLVTITPSMNIADAAHIIHNKKYGCLPVVDAEYRLQGIITDHDFVAMTIQLLDMMDAIEPLEDDDF
jgi:CBS domain-containing membrane protein